MALHAERDYYPEAAVSLPSDAREEWAQAAQNAAQAAMLRAAEGCAWDLTCPVSGQSAAKLPEGYWAGQIVRDDGHVIPCAHDERGQEVAGFGCCHLSSQWLPGLRANLDAELWAEWMDCAAEIRTGIRAGLVPEWSPLRSERSETGHARRNWLSALYTLRTELREAAETAKAAAKAKAEAAAFSAAGNRFAALAALKKGN